MQAVMLSYEGSQKMERHKSNSARNLVNIQKGTGEGKMKRFEEVFMPLIDSLYGMALRTTRNRDDAEDLVQETYLKAYRFRRSFEENTNAKAWIMAIMMNTFRTRYRKSQKEPVTVDYEAVENFLPAEKHHAARQPANRSETRNLAAITEYMRSVVSDDIIKALEAVPLQFRMPVLLSDAEQFDYQEISEILGINIGTVKSRIFRGRKLMQKKLLAVAADRGICGR